MSRPSDWWVVDLSSDPTPGDPVLVQGLARRVQLVADDAGQAQRAVLGLAGDGAVTSWFGMAGEVFRGALHDFPGQLGKLADSYGQAAGALAAYATSLDGAQDSADRALEQGRTAQAEIDSLSSQLSAATATASTAGGTVSAFSRPPLPGAEPPDPGQLRDATRNARTANDRVRSLSSGLGGAQDRLAAAKRMARDAEQLRQDAGNRAADRLYDASDAGIEPNSWWEDFKSAAAKVWDVTITIAKVVVAVLCVIALFAGGPLVWGLLLAGSLLLLADSLAKYANGEGSLWEVGLNLLGVIPGARLLGAAGKLIGRSAQGARALSQGSRALTTGRTALTRMAAGLRDGVGRVFAHGPDAAAWRALSRADQASVLAFRRAAAAAEGDITRSMRGLVDSLPGTRLAGLEYRLKGTLSLGRKIAGDMADVPGATVARIAGTINDAVRYTVVAGGGRYTDDAAAAFRRLQDDGYTLVGRKNTWGSDGYQGINSTWRDPRTGQTFEVQVHTPESLAAKTTTHDMYAAERVLPPGSPEQLELAARQREIFDAVPRPHGAADVRPAPERAGPGR